MIKRLPFRIFIVVSILVMSVSCGSDDSSGYSPLPVVPEVPTSPVVLDMDAEIFPYENLSEYHFYEGEMKNLEPVYKVIPYDLNSSLFTDYAEKKRFIYMPPDTKATYVADGKAMDFPSGTVLIKNFYYTTMLPGSFTQIIETRLMIKKGTQWIFANYVWNDEQTEAVLTNNGGYAHLSFTEGNRTVNTNYRIPSVGECNNCHKPGNQILPLGIKPQNLNKLYPYADGTMNQLQKLVQEGYLNPSGLPSNIVSTVDWKDTSKSLDLRVRSYLDINCAHCHSEGTSCDYTPMRLAFSESDNPVNLGVCISPIDFAPEEITHIVEKQNPTRSLMHFRLNTTVQSEMMPMVGRTVIHTQGVQLIEDWINAMDTPCP